MASCYILYSESIDSFYVGSTTEPIEIRLERHNSTYYENKWATRGIPWRLMLEIKCDKVELARSIESHIKKMKSKVYINNLIRYPEMVSKLKARYHSPDC